jgi:bisphosphoglycerate-dependent phosphoglycerate mutase
MRYADSVEFAKYIETITVVTNIETICNNKNIRKELVELSIVKDYNNSTEYPIYRNCYFEKIKNGESKENVLDRLLPYFENDIMYTLSEHKLPLIVTHKHTARVLMKYLMKMNDEDFEHYEIPNKGIIIMEFDNNNNFNNSRVLRY